MLKVEVQAPLLIKEPHQYEGIKGIVERSASCNWCLKIIFKTPGTTKLENAG